MRVFGRPLGQQIWLYLLHFLPEDTPLSIHERARCAIGAFLGILTTGLISRLAIGDGTSLPLLIAPMGASAVLLFAVPTSPLAQPWSIMGGNLFSALVGVTAAKCFADPFLAASVAASCAIAVMMLLRCLHPPSGAVALTAVLGGPAIAHLGYGFVVWPVGVNSLLLLASAMLFNNSTGRSYPHVSEGRRKAIAAANEAGLGVTSDDIDASLQELDQVIDVGRDDIADILHRAHIHALHRVARGPACADVMSSDVVAVGATTSLHETLSMFRRHRAKALPVTDERANVLGLVTQSAFLDRVAWTEQSPRLRLTDRLRLTFRRGRAPHGSAEDIMATSLNVLQRDTPISEAALRMLDADLTHLPVVGANGKLAGIVSQADVIAALLADLAERSLAQIGPRETHATEEDLASAP